MTTVSLELSRKLYEAGIKIETIYHYAVNDHGLFTDEVWSGEQTQFDIPAPITDELLEWLPEGALVVKVHGQYSAGYEKGKDYVNFRSDTPANALAKLALWVKEQDGK